MNWLFLILTAIAIYTIYNLVILRTIGVPKSLSMTFYLLQEKKKWLRIWFPIMMVSMAFLLMPAWLEISINSPFQFLAFLAPSAIIFTGCAPAFKSSGLENAVHMTSAIVAAITALLWVGLVANLWILIAIWLIIIAVTAIVTKTVKSSYIYWLETIAFITTFNALLVYYL